MSMNTNKPLDKSREGVTWAKVFHYVRLIFLRKATNALLSVESFGDIDFDKLWEEWKRGIILDFDECVAPHHGNILPENMELIKELLIKEWKIVIFSNMKKSDRYKKLEDLWIIVITSQYAKPDERGFEESAETLEIGRDRIIMIGDNYATDGWAIYAGIDFVKVKPIETWDTHKSLKRRAQIVFRTIVDTKARLLNGL